MATKGKWMQSARESMERQGTVGSFTRSAKAAGESVGEYAEKKKHAKGKLGRRSPFRLGCQKVVPGTKEVVNG
jgi:hypothetical protein